MNLLLRIIITAALVMLITHFFPSIAYVDSFKTSVIVAIVLGLLNLFVKPLLVLLTLPVTILTLGLFLLVINAVIIILCTKVVHGFKVDGFIGSLIFSIVLSLSQSLFFKLIADRN
ncbi:MAG: phage holin family protein [Flavobacterium sp.]|nr:phage holin family protein [Flavobacterium sp.]